MANPYLDIDNTRLTAGKLWSSELNLDLMRRDWGLGEKPFDFNLDEVTALSTLLNTWETVGTFVLQRPGPSYGSGDPAINLTWRVGVYLEMKADTASGVPTTSAAQLISTTSTTSSTVALTIDAGYAYSVIWCEHSGLPGYETYTIQMRVDSGTVDYYAKRDYGTRGTDCYIQIDEG
jgi:hypothetical protein